MFDIFAKTLSSIASFLFPLFASYKALKTSDPAQLTPWLMYWVVLACALLVESWTDWFLLWIPFYAYIRLFFLLYLILPQTQGARIIYQEHIHPYLQKNEDAIDDFIASAHDRLRAAGMAYLQDAIEWFKTKVLGMPPRPQQPPQAAASQSPKSYTQNLLARFSLPAARWSGVGDAPASNTPAGDFYSFLAGAVGATIGGSSSASSTPGPGTANRSVIPSTVGEADKASFIATQRDRLTTLLAALDREAAQLSGSRSAMPPPPAPAATTPSKFGRVMEVVEGLNLDKNLGSASFPWSSGAADESSARPPSDGSSAAGLSKSRSEQDFEKIEAESGAEDADDGAGVRRRAPQSGGSWMPWGWGASPGAGGSNADPDVATSSGVEK